jgi:hypothetical protein
LETTAQERWVSYFHTFTRQCDADGWDFPHQFDRAERDIANLHAVMLYCYNSHRWEYLVEMVLCLRSFWGTRGYYEARDALIALALQVAERDNNVEAQIRLLCMKVRALYYQDDVKTAAECCKRARELLATFDCPLPSLVATVNYAEIRVCILLGDLDKLRTLAQHNVDIAEKQRWPQHALARYSIAEYLYRAGKYHEAEQLYKELNALSADLGYHRAPIRGWLALAKIALCTERLAEAEAYLQHAQDLAQRLTHLRYLAEVHHVWAQLHILHGDLAATQDALNEALSLFERLGLRRELAKVRTELAHLEAGEHAEVTR